VVCGPPARPGADRWSRYFDQAVCSENERVSVEGRSATAPRLKAATTVTIRVAQNRLTGCDQRLDAAAYLRELVKDCHHVATRRG
jgi:hypothetical protein